MDTILLAFVLIVIGHLLMGSELILPTHGIAFALGMGAVVVGIVMVFGYDGRPVGIPGPILGLGVAVGEAIFMLTVWPILLHFWKQTPMGKRLVLDVADEEDTMARTAVNVELLQLKGRYGRTLSSLRPSGVTDFDGRRIDTVSEGTMIDPGVWVRCIDVKAGRVIVRQVERPPDLADMDPDILKG